LSGDFDKPKLDYGHAEVRHDWLLAGDGKCCAMDQEGYHHTADMVLAEFFQFRRAKPIVIAWGFENS
jgi:hypothetical protein